MSRRFGRSELIVKGPITAVRAASTMPTALTVAERLDVYSVNAWKARILEA